jgi:hypothetical protein
MAKLGQGGIAKVKGADVSEKKKTAKLEKLKKQ